MPKRRSLRLAEKAKRLEEEVKCQEVEERKVKKPRIDEGSVPSNAPDFNPFLVEPILRKLLTKVEKVAQLKDLRKMCVLWDNVNMEEIEDRAIKGKLKVIDFEWTNRGFSKIMAEQQLVRFMKDTRSITRFFRSFKLNIPESLKILKDHTAFFSDYHICGVELINAPYHSQFKHFAHFEVAIKYFLSLIGPNLRDIKILHPTNKAFYKPFEPRSESPNWPKSEHELVLPKLEKLVIENKWWDKELTELFKSALVKDSGRITSLALPSLPGADIGSFPGLDPARMTRLDLGGIKGTSSALKYTTGLMTLVEKGMRLLNLGLKLDENYHEDTPASFAQNLPRICSNLTHFFAAQSQTLATLDLHLGFYCTWPGSEDEMEAEVGTYGKIQLPVFQELHNLSFGHRLQMVILNPDRKVIAFSLIETTNSPPLHFPSLINVKFDSECSMGIFFDYPEPIELAEESRFHFKRLEIKDGLSDLDRWNTLLRGNWNTLYGSMIGSVDFLRVPKPVLEEVRIPWGDSLRELNTKYISAPCKLAHLKKLEKLVIEDNSMVGYKPYVEVPTGVSYEDDDYLNMEQENVTKYLSWLKEAKQLSLEYIKFIGLQIVERGVKEEFIRYFPYPVIFDKGGR